MKKLKKLNLGCGKDIRSGYINVDFEKAFGADIIHNLNKLPYPFSGDQFSEIVMQNVLEHLDDPFNVMKEIYRISAQNSKIIINVPHFSSNNTWGDIQHKRGFNSETFSNKNMKEMFEIVKQEITFPHLRFFMRPLVRLNPVFYEKHLAYIFPAVDLKIELKVKK